MQSEDVQIPLIIDGGTFEAVEVEGQEAERVW